ncbi:MAG: hypothetical protein ACYCYK_06080 [Candidatus Dormibacteria bacterium]
MISRLGDGRAWSVAARDQDAGPLVVLVHDAVLETSDSVMGYLGDVGAGVGLLARILASRRDASRHLVVERWPTIDYRQFVELMVEAERVISW